MSHLTRNIIPSLATPRRSLLLIPMAAALLAAAIAVRAAMLTLPGPAAVPPSAATPAATTPANSTAAVAPAQNSGAAVSPLTQDPVTLWQDRLARDPTNANAAAQLGLAWLQRVRETNDFTLYPRAQQAFDTALTHDPQQVDALTGRGMLANALHDFRGALTWADRVLHANPYRAAGFGIRVDALVELGRYDEAVAALQQMVNLRPDLESYSRISYVRELYGDLPGAMQAMRMAAATAQPGSEPWLWTTTHLANLYLVKNDIATAEAIYRDVLRYRADYPFAQLGMARVYTAQGKRDEALVILKPLAARLPLPEILVALGELYAASGDTRHAEEQYDLVRVIEQLNAAAGMNVDLELATFEVVHGKDAAAALEAARRAYAVRPTIFAADTLAWALHRTGDDQAAWRYSQEALRLGSQDLTLHAHAAVIAKVLDTPKP